MVSMCTCKYTVSCIFDGLLNFQWQPRRASSGSNPRPIHEIRQEVYIEHSSGRVATKHPPPLGVTSYSQSQISESSDLYM